MAAEASAKKMRISPMETRRRLEKVGLVRRLLSDCYGVMHTQSLRNVAEDVVEASRDWEATASEGAKGGELRSFYIMGQHFGWNNPWRV